MTQHKITTAAGKQKSSRETKEASTSRDRERKVRATTIVNHLVGVKLTSSVTGRLTEIAMRENSPFAIVTFQV